MEKKSRRRNQYALYNHPNTRQHQSTPQPAAVRSSSRRKQTLNNSQSQEDHPILDDSRVQNATTTPPSEQNTSIEINVDHQHQSIQQVIADQHIEDQQLEDQQPIQQTSDDAMEAFLEAQTQYLQKQQQFAEQEEIRKKELHQAQLKELKDRKQLLALQEEQNEDSKAQKERHEKTKQKLRQADRLEKWTDGDQADAYLVKFETVMTECEIPKEHWKGRLVNCLTGKALSAYRAVIQVGEDDHYDAMKDKLLEAMGLGIEQTRRKFWNPNKRSTDSPMDMLRQLDSCYSRIARDCTSPAELRQEILIGRLLSLYPPDIADYIYLRKPTNAHQAAHFLQNYLDSHPWRRHQDNSGRQQQVSGLGGGARHGGGDLGHDKEHSNRKGLFNKDRGDKRGREQPKGKDQSPTRIPVCFGCGVKGHKRPECPDKIEKTNARVGKNIRSKARTLLGKVGTNSCSMTLDSGADHTVVRADLITEADYTGQSSRVGDYYGCWRDVPMAKVWIGIGKEYKFRHEVLVVPRDCPHEVLLGNDLIMFDELYKLACPQGDSDPQVKAITRAEAKRQSEREELDKALDAKDGAQPIQCEGPQPIQCEGPSAEDGTQPNQREGPIAKDGVQPIQCVGPSVSADSVDVSVGSEESEYESGEETPGSQSNEQASDPENYSEDEECVEGVTSLLEMGGERAKDIPLPDIVGGVEEKTQLIEEQSKDESLKQLRDWAKKGERGYAFDDGLLVHTLVSPAEQICKRIVVPSPRRSSLLKLAHSSILGGHFSHGKTTELLNRRFTWPRMSVDVKKLCQQCMQCQKASRARVGKAPLQPLPVLDVPFSKLAFDLVGPLPRTRSGYRYVLTSICLASKYPEAIPLKRVDVESVAEGLCEVFSRTGIPAHILTDQGSVFTSKLVKQLCQTLGIKHVKSSPYHPESNGCLERWHSTLKATLRKHQEKYSNWDKLLKYILFACRSAPHANTGYSPFELVFGRQLRGPLDVVHDGWLGGDLPQSSAEEWIQNLRDSLTLVWEVAVDKEGLAKDKMAQRSKKKATSRHFSQGDQVLVRVVDPGGKLGDRWDGPYEVESKVAEVTYRIAVPHRRTKCMTAHVNRLKPWNAPDASILRVVVADEEVEDREKEPDWRALLEPQQLHDINDILTDYKDQIDGSLGEGRGLSHAINTEGHDPSWTPPHRIAPAWREPLKEEVKSWLEQGIIRPSNSPWSSPVVPIRKPDGSLRLCVDYRKLNKITTPDPYPIPRIDDLIDELNSAKYLTKIDLNKGFLQIPVNPRDQPKTAFQTPWGKFEFTRMPFGLMNAPATFQRSMNHVLQGLEQFSACYIDDIVVHSNNWADHVRQIREVLERLKKFGLTVNLKKCAWGVAEIEYLGHTVGKGRVSIPDMRVKALKDFKQPVTKKELKSYLGMLGYYRKFIPGFSSIAMPLTGATHLKSPNRLNWTKHMGDAFNTLRDALCSHTQLTIPSPEDSFTLSTDASGVGIGAVLSITRNGMDLPVAYFSRKLSKHKENYAITELECLALVKATEHFGHYLVGKHFIVKTDHKPLEALQTSKRLTGRLARWALSLQYLNYTVQYKPGTQHQNADGMSRQAWEKPDTSLVEDVKLEGGGDVEGQPPRA